MTDNHDIEPSRAPTEQAAGQNHVELIVVRVLLVGVGVGLATLLIVAIWP